MTVGVIGAGITGLAVTHYLAESGVDVVTFEADAEPGGVIRSERVDGRLLEAGPQRIRLTPTLESLIEDLGLEDDLLEADESLPLYVYADGEHREVPRSVSAFLRTDLLSWRSKLRLLAEPLTASATPEERAADLFRRKFGDGTYRNVVEPLFGGIYGSDPAEMPAEYSLSRLISMDERKGSLLRAAVERILGDGDVPPPVSFVDGLQTLPETLYEEHEPYVHLNATVESVRASDDGYVVTTGGRSVTVDRVVVTVPAHVAASILSGLEEAYVDPLGNLTYNSLGMVYLHSKVDATGFGYQCRRDEPLETLGVTYNDSLFDRDGVYTAFFGGMHDPEIIERDPEDLAAVAREEFREVMDADPEVISVKKLPRALPAYDVTWDALDAVELPEGVMLATNYTSRIGVPSRIREAKSLTDRLEATTAPKVAAR